ncbi:uncharacterized protein LOC123555656 [Mercenaria mercenaria]|uniref:uncharacterized protein LOC123555656 n=1 Tax=Mercenaria mercenaria TaxID=6596 RepID=UPI00234F1CCC|nr:uncharacterized protein LOC123555656 [Mercenaria mercenaria]
MANYYYMITFLPLAVASTEFAHQENSPCVFSFMENVLEKMFKMRARMDEMEQKIAEVESRQANNTNVKTPVVAFRIMLNKTLESVSSGTMVKFNLVDFNIGNTYNDGIFTAPYSGTYLLSTTLGNPMQIPGNFFMKKNGVGIEYNIAGHTAGFNVGGVTTVAKLLAGDRVWVEGSGRITGPYDIPGYYTSFSGFLISTI